MSVKPIDLLPKLTDLSRESVCEINGSSGKPLAYPK